MVESTAVAVPASVFSTTKPCLTSSADRDRPAANLPSPLLLLTLRSSTTAAPHHCFDNSALAHCTGCELNKQSVLWVASTRCCVMIWCMQALLQSFGRLPSKVMRVIRLLGAADSGKQSSQSIGISRAQHWTAANESALMLVAPPT